MSEDRIEDALRAHFARDEDDASAGRVMMKLGTLPPQKHATRWSWPQLLLDRQFAPAWPRIAALAGCAALGFVIGSASINHLVPSTRNGVAQLVFEPEPLTGLRP